MEATIMGLYRVYQGQSGFGFGVGAVILSNVCARICRDTYGLGVEAVGFGSRIEV